VLEELGIPRPARIPSFFEMPPERLATGGEFRVRGSRTSGEVEPVYLRIARHWYLGLGSDHTDRELERESIGDAKASCPKPIATVVVPVGADLAGLDDGFDDIEVASTVDGRAYQAGRLHQLRPPSDVLARLFSWTGEGEGSDLVVFGGTIPLIGEFAYGSDWQMQLTRAGVTITLDYRIHAAKDGDEQA
jgi:4-hydroxyphenylacetate 3-monooxygenase